MPVLHDHLRLAGLDDRRDDLKPLIMLPIGSIELSLDLLSRAAVVPAGTELTDALCGTVVSY